MQMIPAKYIINILFMAEVYLCMPQSYQILFSTETQASMYINVLPYTADYATATVAVAVQLAKKWLSPAASI
jgi:hypothetical protein